MAYAGGPAIVSKDPIPPGEPTRPTPMPGTNAGSFDPNVSNDGPAADFNAVKEPYVAYRIISGE